MPLYDATCRECGKTFEHFAKVDERRVQCIECGGEAWRILTTNYSVHGDVDFVTDNISGEPVRVTSKRQLRQLMTRHGVSEKYGKGWV